MPWLTAVAGAVIGAALYAAYTTWLERRAFAALVAELRVELHEIKLQAAARLQRSSTVAGDLDPPLPVEAWRLVVSSGKLDRLPPDGLGRLRSLYSDVVAANYLAGHWVHFLQIARLSNNEQVWVAFDREAAKVMCKPAAPIVAKIDEVIADLEKTQKSRRLGSRKGTST